MPQEMKESLFQPRWRRMKEKPPARKPGPSKKAALRRTKVDASWPAASMQHRIDKQGRA